jgi:hypothetical protein
MASCPLRFHLTKSNGRSVCILQSAVAAENEESDRSISAFHFTSDPIDAALAEKHVVFTCQGRCSVFPSVSSSSAAAAAAAAAAASSRALPHSITCVPWCVLSNFESQSGSSESQESDKQNMSNEDADYFYPVRDMSFPQSIFVTF